MYLSACSCRTVADVLASQNSELISSISSLETFGLPNVSLSTYDGVIICTTYLKLVFVPIVARCASASSSISTFSVAQRIAKI